MGRVSGGKREPLAGLAGISLADFLDRFTLILGEINRGKTVLTQRVLETYCRERGGRATIVDLAPTMSPADVAGKAIGKGVGGGLQVPASGPVRYFHGTIHPPRLRARDEQEAEALAQENARTIEAIFEEALGDESDALFVNDCSLYLHAGSPARMLQWVRGARTAVVNGYYGQSFGRSDLSRREREGMTFLKEQCDRLIHL